MTRPIVGLSDEKTAEVIGRVRQAIAEGATDLDALITAVALDAGLVTAAVRRIQESGELTLNPSTRTFSLKDH